MERSLGILVTPAAPCVLHEDAHLLVVNKPAGWNTHAPGPFAGEGIYDWLRHREARWATLAIIHRLDKETSGVMLFAKSKLANRSLTEQFSTHSVRKRYVFLTDKPLKPGVLEIKSALVRAGEKYVSRPIHAGAQIAETTFELLKQTPQGNIVQARPRTGRTHQIRVHAAQSGFPVLGDRLYGGSHASRLCLHAEELSLAHPCGGKSVSFKTPADFDGDSGLALRAAVIDPEQTSAFRVINGAADGWPGWYVDRLGDFLLSQADGQLSAAAREKLEQLEEHFCCRGSYHKRLRRLRDDPMGEASPKPLQGQRAEKDFVVRENSLQYALSFQEGPSTGLFLDQRDNRRRFLTNHVSAGFALFPNGGAAKEVLNAFAYTCGFSVSAAMAGARVTSLDLSRKYLEWGKRNFDLNGLDPALHEFIFGDAFDWLRRLAKKGRAFDVIVLDPPTFSQSKGHGTFQAEKDYAKLAGLAMPLLRSGGILFASTNAAKLAPEKFLRQLIEAVLAKKRRITRQHYFPQPADFPINREEPAYLKTVWLQVA